MYKFGTPKDLDSITKDDVIENKVWIWVWEADLGEEYSEDWQVPVLGLNNLEEYFTEPIITLQVENSDVIVSASYDFSNDKIYAISIWEKDRWEVLDKSSIKEPIIFTSLIRIKGIEDKKFICKSKAEDIAHSI